LSIGICSDKELIVPNWIDEQIQQQRFADMARAARRDQLADAAQAASLKRARFYNPILARLGRWLEQWGYQLQARYGSEVAIATESSGNSSSY
jgi:hypothetical protein